ncbi:hypothetical protein N0V88_000416 [Collariella sp. IMI 366227]|nr:hypothetical protein N0V88_000416 [Collariella sp. IMI 366227]
MANNDNAMARFLFAILQQKCLKDIDWNQVAHNPILTQEITNGHAARMRYSRFRAAMLGLEPQRRNRTNANKSKVSKKKKDETPKPKKEEPEHSSGSGIGNIKMENRVDITTVKSERRSVSQALPQPTQPPAPMATPAMMKTEPGVANAYQHIHHPSIFSVSSPRVKNERLPTATTTTKPPNPMPEPSTFNIPTTAASSSTTYLDKHPRMPTMRLLTPCSDSDGSHVAQGFLPRNSPPPNDLPVHNQHAHHHPHQHHILVGAGSPPLSTAAPSPYEFSQCLDATAAGTPSPWQSQQQHLHTQHHSQHHHIHNQNADLLYAASFGLGLGNGTGTAGGAGFALDNVYNPFGSEHQHYHHPLQQFRMHHEEDEQHVADALGLHPGAGATAGMFREREMDVGNDSGIGLGLDLAGQGVKCEWDADADGYHDV